MWEEERVERPEEAAALGVGLSVGAQDAEGEIWIASTRVWQCPRKKGKAE